MISLRTSLVEFTSGCSSKQATLWSFETFEVQNFFQTVSNVLIFWFEVFDSKLLIRSFWLGNFFDDKFWFERLSWKVVIQAFDFLVHQFCFERYASNVCIERFAWEHFALKFCIEIFVVPMNSKKGQWSSIPFSDEWVLRLEFCQLWTSGTVCVCAINGQGA